MASAPKLRFVDKNGSEFFALVKSRVDQYFTEKNLSKNANALMIFKTFFFFGGTFVLLGLTLFGGFSLWAMLVMAIVMGVLQACVGFNVSHDAIHGAYSGNPTINKIIAYSFGIVGANQTVWALSHNIVHHTYTNIEGHDEDLIIAPGLVRLTKHDKKAPIQRYQQYYAFLLYGFASLSWVFRKDYIKFHQDKIGQQPYHPKKTFRDYFELYFFKALNYTLFIVLPLVLIDGLAWWQWLIGFFCMHLAMGFTLGLVFQLAHVVEETEMVEVNIEGNVEEAWAVHQMRTTADFARASWLVTFMVGGLNYQVEHHLFPKVCHVHYPAISHIVKQTAEDCGVPYLENKTFLGALKSHYTVLKRLGTAA